MSVANLEVRCATGIVGVLLRLKAPSVSGKVYILLYGNLLLGVSEDYSHKARSVYRFDQFGTDSRQTGKVLSENAKGPGIADASPTVAKGLESCG